MTAAFLLTTAVGLAYFAPCLWGRMVARLQRRREARARLVLELLLPGRVETAAGVAALSAGRVSKRFARKSLGDALGLGLVEQSGYRSIDDVRSPRIVSTAYTLTWRGRRFLAVGAP